MGRSLLRDHNGLNRFPPHKSAEPRRKGRGPKRSSRPPTLEIIGDELHVRLGALSAPRRSRAIAALCNELTDTATLYPGTDLRLVYSVKGY